MTKKSQNITDIILDFDGTCTNIPVVADQYLEKFRQLFNDTVEPVTSGEWKEACDQVNNNSPKAGWMLSGCPSAPAGADPYILAFEAANLILRMRGSKNSLPGNIHHDANNAHPAPWRDDARTTIEKIIEKNIPVHFISNSSTKKIHERLQELFDEGNPILKKISVQSDAAKFKICELPWDKDNEVPSEVRAQFEALPARFDDPSVNDMGRPVYLRRGSYFEAIYQVLKSDWSKLSTTVFCGDIWEMDMSMPYMLGASVHLIERESPFDTYDYERKAVTSYGDRGKISKELSGVLEWI